MTDEVVRYIKLGRAGIWERGCLRDGVARFGTSSRDPRHFAAAAAGRWEDLKALFIADGSPAQSATRFANDTRAFFSQGPSLWITFSVQRLWWCHFEPGLPERHDDGDGTFRRVRGMWRDTDRHGRQLRMERLAGTLTKSAGYRGTTFQLRPSNAGYVIRRINGESSPEIARAQAAVAAMRISVRELLQGLAPRDFELLVDLVFSGSGWRRITELGRTQKTLDLVVELPSTGEHAWIQIKSYADRTILGKSLAEELPYQRMFFVYHSGDVGEVDNPRISVIGPDKLAELVIDGGLVGWLIDRVS